MNDLSAVKLKMMKGSMRCMVYGMLALVPAIGLPFGLVALWLSGRLRHQEKQLWNPAKPYRLIGAICAALGTVLWAGILLIIFGNLLMFIFGIG